MTRFEEEVKRPVIGIDQSSIKPVFRKTVEFYANKIKEYHNSFSDVNKYIDFIKNALEKKDEEISDLKSQLQQQALPVVSECVDKWYKFHIDGTFSAVVSAYAFNEADEEVIWIAKNGGMALLCKMYLYGYTVEKSQLFYLKNKITGNVLVYDESPELSEVSELFATGGEFELENYTFTQQEIDSMETGSYELVPVEDGE